MNESRIFDKILAKIQIGFTVFATLGSVLIALGVSFIIFANGINLQAADKTGNVQQFLQTVYHNEYDLGLRMTVTGFVVLLVGIPYFWYLINKLKDNTNEQKPEVPNDKEQNKSKRIYFRVNTKIKLLVIGLIVFSVIEGLIIFVPYDYSKVQFDYKFFTDVVLVSIPIGGGALTTKLVANSWQIRSAKIEMKNQVLEELDKSIRLSAVLLQQFVFNLMMEYGNSDPDTFNLQTGESALTINFPSEVKDQPHVKFAEKFKKLKEDFNQTIFDYQRCDSYIKLYYQSEEMSKEWLLLDRRIQYSRSLVFKLMESKTKEDFKSTYKKYDESYKISITMIRDFQKKLIDTKITKITV